MGATPSAGAATLWARITEVYQTATSTGSAQGIKATQKILEDSDLGIKFVVYVADSLSKKPKAPPQTECAFQSFCVSKTSIKPVFASKRVTMHYHVPLVPEFVTE